MSGKINEAKRALTEHKGRFTNEMPEIHLFTPERLIKIYSEVGIKAIRVTGFPVSLYPGLLETKIKGNTKLISYLFKNESNFNNLIKIEDILTDKEDVAARGNNLFVVGVKK